MNESSTVRVKKRTAAQINALRMIWGVRSADDVLQILMSRTIESRSGDLG